MLNLIPFSPSRFDATQFLIQEIRPIIKNEKDFLDVGCGKLFFYNLLVDLEAGGRFTGIDLDPGKISRQSSKIQSKLVRADFLKFQTSKRYDLVTCLWVLEHIRDDRKAIEKLHSLVNTNGFLILAVPSIWSWPFEFGRHGYHYYSENLILRYLKDTGLKVIKLYNSAGILGFSFMLFYNWSRFLILILSLPFYLMLSTIGLYRKSWKDFSSDLISSTLYRYHRSEFGIFLHNSIVKFIVAVDNKLKVLSASYIVIAKK